MRQIVLAIERMGAETLHVRRNRHLNFLPIIAEKHVIDDYEALVVHKAPAFGKCHVFDVGKSFREHDVA